VSLLAVIPFAMIKSGEPPSDSDRIRFTKELFRTRGWFYARIFMSTFFIGMGAGLTIPFLNLYFRDRFDLPPDTIGMYYSLVHVSMLIGSLAGPVLTKKFGLVRTVVLTQSLAIPLMGVLSYSHSLVAVVIAFVVRGGLMNLGWPIVNNLSMELATEKERGLVNALLMVGWNASWMISAALGGNLIEEYGYTVTINITVVLYIISTLTFYWFFRNSETRRSNGRGWSIVREAQ
jgi:predicted MFS family arabinose efflux permease